MSELFHRFFLWFALLSVIVFPAQHGFAQAPVPNASGKERSVDERSLEERLDTLERDFHSLEQRLDAALERLAAAGRGPAEWTQSAVTGGSPLRQLAALEQKVSTVERLSHEVQGSVARMAPPEKASVNFVVGAGREGFFLRSMDGTYSFNLHGTIQADGRFFGTSAPQPGASTFVASKVRPSFEGVLLKNFGFRVMPDFGNGTTVLQEAYFELTLQPWLKLRAGKYKGPVGLERLVADTDVKFFERALPTNLVPNRDVGVQIYGEPWGGVITYAGGIFNGVADGASADLDSDNHREFEGRLFSRPFLKSKLGPLAGLGVGVAGTSGRETGTLDSTLAGVFKTSAQQIFFHYYPGQTFATVVANGEHWRISPQANYYWGPLGAWGEYVLSSQELKRGALAQGTIENRAWQVAGTYLLTGEKAAYGAVTPASDFDRRRRQWGAIEVVGRFSELRIDRAAFPRFADPQTSASGAKAWALGLNWYLNRNVKLVFNYERTEFMTAAAGQKRKNEDAFLERLQIAF